MKVTKKLLAVLLGLTLMVSMGVSALATETESTNLLQNPGFEAGLEGWTAKRTSHNEESALSAEYTEDFAAPSADAGAKFAQFPYNYGAAVLSQKVTGLTGGSIYRFSGSIHTTSTNAVFTRDDYLYVAYTVYSGETPVGEAVKMQPKTPVGAWTGFNVSVVLPADADGLEVAILHIGGDSFVRCYDGFVLEEMEFAQPDNNLIINPGFEAGVSNWDISRNNDATYKPVNTLRTYGETYSTANHTFAAAPGTEYGANYITFSTNTKTATMTQKVENLKGGASFLFMGQAYFSHSGGAKAPDINVICTYYNGETEISTEKVLQTIAPNTWTTMKAIFTMPKEANALAVGITSGTAGDNYIRSYDNFYLVPTDNLLLNGSFDEKLANWGGTADVNVETDFPASGRPGGGLAYAGNSAGWGRIVQSLPAVGGATYKFSYWFKSADESVPKNSNISLRFFEEEQTDMTNTPVNSLCHVDVLTTKVLSTDGWQQYIAYVKAPANAKSMSVVIKSYSTAGGKGNCIYDDVKLIFADQSTEFLGFSSLNPASVVGGDAVQNESSFKDAVAYSAVVTGAKNAAATISQATGVQNSTKIYAAAVDLKSANTTLLFSRFSMDGGVKRLEAVEVVKPDANGLISASLDVPETGTYFLEAYVWEGAGGLKPIMEPIELR